MKSTTEQIQLAIACTTCRGDSIPNIYRVRAWLIEHNLSSWIGPTMNEIRLHLGSSDVQPDEHELWIGNKHEPARAIYKPRKQPQEPEPVPTLLGPREEARRAG